MKFAIAGLALVLTSFIGLGVFAKRTLESEPFQDALREQVQTAFAGSTAWADVEWTTADAPFFSASLDLLRPVLRLGPASDDRGAAFLRMAADSGEARLDPWTLLSGRAELRSFRLSRGELEIQPFGRSGEPVWRVDDLELDLVSEQVSERKAASIAGTRRFSVRASGGIPRQAGDGVAMSADGLFTTDGDGGLALAASVDFGPHGRMGIDATRAASASGSDSPPGQRSDLALELDQVDLAMFPVSSAARSFDLKGLATGSVRLTGATPQTNRVEIDVRLTDADLRMPEYSVEGIVPAEVSIEGAFSERPSGRIELDLTHARFDFRGRFEKPAGQGASVTTVFGPGVDDELEFESHVSLRDLHQILSVGGSARPAD